MPVLLNRREACAVLNCSFAKFKTMLEQGIIPPGVGGGPHSLRWDRDEIIAHLKKRVSDQRVADAEKRATRAA